jgi:hypothetical protein
MRAWHWTLGGLLATLILASGSANAGRTPSTRNFGQKSTGSRTDITVPYLTTGKTAFGAYYVAPRIYSSPIVDDPKNPQAKPVYNLPFYGGRQAFGDASNGATPRSK